MHTSWILTFAVAAACAATPVTRTDPFIGELSDGFEGRYGVFTTPIDTLDGHATVANATEGGPIHIVGGWTSHNLDHVSPHSGSRMLGASHGGVKWVFDTPAREFGGYFASINLGSNLENATVEFFDIDDHPIGTDTVIALFHNRWTWNGWTFNVPVKSIVMAGWLPPAYPGSGPVMADDIQYTPIPEPGTIALLTLGAPGLWRRLDRSIRNLAR